jgi:hypothetical protein
MERQRFNFNIGVDISNKTSVFINTSQVIKDSFKFIYIQNNFGKNRIIFLNNEPQVIK